MDRMIGRIAVLATAIVGLSASGLMSDLGAGATYPTTTTSSTTTTTTTEPQGDPEPTTTTSTTTTTTEAPTTTSTTTTTTTEPPSIKVFVCKYVGTPGLNEVLQTGQNPISVSVNAIPAGAAVGAFFADAQGRSFVIAYDEGQDEPDCPGGDTPTTTSTTTTQAPTTTSTTTTEPEGDDEGTTTSTSTSTSTTTTTKAPCPDCGINTVVITGPSTTTTSTTTLPRNPCDNCDDPLPTTTVKPPVTPLPQTGGDPSLMSTLAILLVSGGVVAAMAARRRE